jgi:hypothetical protein
MELLTTSPKAMYLLDTRLEILHEQSNEWLNEIAFWRDEVAFFYSLIVNKTLKVIPISAKDNIIKIENELIKITGGELDELQEIVERHENFLCHLLETKNANEEIYKEKHRELANKFDQFEKHFKSLKKDVFALVKLIDKSVK